MHTVYCSPRSPVPWYQGILHPRCWQFGEKPAQLWWIVGVVQPPHLGKHHTQEVSCDIPYFVMLNRWKTTIGTRMRDRKGVLYMDVCVDYVQDTSMIVLCFRRSHAGNDPGTGKRHSKLESYLNPGDTAGTRKCEYFLLPATKQKPWVCSSFNRQHRIL